MCSKDIVLTIWNMWNKQMNNLDMLKYILF